MAKEKWLLVITDKDNEDVVFDNVSSKPSKYKSEGNARFFLFEGTKIDEIYGKLKSVKSEHELGLFVGEMQDKDMPGGLNEVLKAAFGDEWKQYMIPSRRNNK